KFHDIKNLHLRIFVQQGEVGDDLVLNRLYGFGWFSSHVSSSVGLLNEFYDPLKAFGQLVNFAPRIVNSKRRPYRSFYAKPVHQRLRAMVASSDGNAPGIQHLTDIKGMYTLYNER